MTKIPGARLSLALALLMLAQSALGLLLPDQYRDPALYRATWFGNDWITLLAGVPLLVSGLAAARRGSRRGRMLWLGAIGYAAYNYPFYLFGAALNAFLPLYVAAVVLAAVTLIVALAHLDASDLARSFRPATPVRALGGTLGLIGAGLGAVWVLMWAAHVFGGRPTPVAPEAFKVVAALDLTLMVPALTIGGALLWQRRPWGYVLATLASIQGALYLLVLTVNTSIAIRRELVPAPGELPVWGALLVVTTIIAVALLANVRRDAAPAA